VIKQRKFYLLSLIIFSLSVGIRFPFKSKMFASWDGPQFAIAMHHYSIKDYFPEFPGHYLYVMSAKFINYFLGDPFLSLLYLSIIFSGLICVALFWVGTKIFDFRVGILSSLIYIASPLFWHYNSTINPFPMEGFFVLLTGFFLFEVIYKKQENFLLWASLFYGLMMGTRPQDFIFLFPLWAWAFFRVKTKLKIFSLAVLILVCLAWFIPMSLMSGGVKELASFIWKEFSSGQSRLSSSVFNIPGLLKANLKYQIFTYFITFGLGVIPLFYYLPQFFNVKSIFSNKRAQIFLFWIIPSLAFWSFFNFATPGYIIVSLLPMIILLAEFLNVMAGEVIENTPLKIKYLKSRNAVLAPFMSLFIFTNVFAYLYDFKSQHEINFSDSFRRYPDSEKIDAQLSEKLEYIRKNIPAENSIIVSSSSFFMQAMYYLPDYYVYLFGGITHQSSTSVAYGHNFKRRIFSDFDTSNLLSDNHIEYIVFFDDRFNEWVDTKSQKETIPIAGRYHLTVVRPQRGQRLTYSYRNIQIR